ncbi:MAG: hypothetical protein KC621_05535 [Myxococcales bacterium]|nr:hypothetical protein [Myxococcales bacterium]
MASRMTNYERLDIAAEALGSPPLHLHVDEVIEEARRRYPDDLASSPRAGLAASMDYQTINVRGRTHVAHDFSVPARWNRAPAFIKVGPATYRRLSASEREKFRRAWDVGASLLRSPDFTDADWARLDPRLG